MLNLLQAVDLTEGVTPCTLGGMDTYSIIRNHQSKPTEVIRTGLSLAEAQKHCQDPTTQGGHAETGTAWFDGYEVEPKVFEGYAQVAQMENGDTVLGLPGAVAAICSSTFDGSLVAFISSPGGGLFAATSAEVVETDDDRLVTVDLAPSALVQGF